MALQQIQFLLPVGAGGGGRLAQGLQLGAKRIDALLSIVGFGLKQFMMGPLIALQELVGVDVFRIAV